MKKGVLLSLVAVLLIGYGFAIGYYKVFPFAILQGIKRWAASGTSDDQVVESGHGGHWRNRVSHFKLLEASPETMMLGDSLTEGGEWSELFPNADIANRGISGDTARGLLDRLDQAISRKPEQVFVMIGANDFFAGVGLEEVIENYGEIVRRLDGEEIHVVVLSTLYIGQGDATEHNANIKRLNQFLVNFCQQNSLEFLDLNRVLAPDGTLSEQFSRDGVHLNGEGYALWAAAMAPSIGRRAEAGERDLKWIP